MSPWFLLGTFAGYTALIFWLGYSLARMRAHWDYGDGLSLKELRELRHALSDWADRFEKAAPSRKYLKQREAQLFEVCCGIGLGFIRPMSSSSRKP